MTLLGDINAFCPFVSLVPATVVAEGTKSPPLKGALSMSPVVMQLGDKNVRVTSASGRCMT